MVFRDQDESRTNSRRIRGHCNRGDSSLLIRSANDQASERRYHIEKAQSYHPCKQSKPLEVKRADRVPETAEAVSDEPCRPG